MKIVISAVLLAAVTFIGQAQAGLILNPRTIGALSQIDFLEKIGNSFTAEDPFVRAALGLDSINPSSDPTDPILFELFSGVGTGGALLFSESFVVGAGFTGFFDVDLTSVPLVIGDDYSFVASIVGDSPYWGAERSTGTVGMAIQNGNPGTGHFALRVTPLPEPTTVALMGLGLAGIGFSRKRKTA